MTYIYNKDGHIVSQRDIRPNVAKVIELERMIPMPVKDGFIAILNADFITNKVWYELIETEEHIRIRKVEEISQYDTSSAVNEFFVNDVPMWFNKNERASLQHLADTEQALDNTNISLWTTTTPPVRIDMTIEQMKQMLIVLENYAMKCYNTTQQHIANVYGLTDIEEVKVYDYQTGYPEKLRF